MSEIEKLDKINRSLNRINKKEQTFKKKLKTKQSKRNTKIVSILGFFSLVLLIAIIILANNIGEREVIVFTVVAPIIFTLLVEIIGLNKTSKKESLFLTKLLTKKLRLLREKEFLEKSLKKKESWDELVSKYYSGELDSIDEKLFISILSTKRQELYKTKNNRRARMVAELLNEEKKQLNYHPIENE